MGTNFEYTAMGTPQQNGLVEGKFATLYGRIRSIMRETRKLKAKLVIMERNASWMTMLSKVLETLTECSTSKPIE